MLKLDKTISTVDKRSSSGSKTLVRVENDTAAKSKTLWATRAWKEGCYLRSNTAQQASAGLQGGGAEGVVDVLYP